MNSKTLKHQLLTMSFGVMTGRALGFIQGVLLARTLGPAALGLYVTLIMSCGIIARAIDFGLPHATVYHLRRTPEALPRLLKTVLLHGLACSLLAAAFVWLLMHLPLPIAEPLRDSLWLKIVVFVSIAMGTAANMLPQFLMASGSYKRYVAFFNGGAALQILVLSATYLIWGASVQGFFTANVMTQTIMAILLTAFLAKKALTIRNPIRPSARALYTYGLKSHWGVLMKLSNTQMEVPIIASVIPTTLVGQYAVGATLREATLMPNTFYAGILQNMLADQNKNPDKGGRLLLLKSMMFQFGLSLSLFLAAVVALPFLIPRIYGEGFSDAVPVALLLILGTLFSSISGLCRSDFHASGRPQVSSLAETLSGLLGPVLILVMASRWGIVGAGFASLGTHFVTFCLSFYLICKLKGYRLKDFRDAFYQAYSLVRRILTRPMRESD